MGGGHDGEAAARAQDDLYQHVNAAWLKANPVPPAYGRWGTFEKLNDDSLVQTKEVLESAGPADKAGAWLASGLNAGGQDAAAALAPTLALAEALAAASVGRSHACFFCFVQAKQRHHLGYRHPPTNYSQIHTTHPKS
jgi:hypothetical protein